MAPAGADELLEVGDVWEPTGSGFA